MCSILALKLLGMAYSFNVEAVIKTMLEKILRCAIPLILYTNSKLLYHCLVKLGITQEKQLMVDKISLRQS